MRVVPAPPQWAAPSLVASFLPVRFNGQAFQAGVVPLDSPERPLRRASDVEVAVGLPLESASTGSSGGQTVPPPVAESLATAIKAAMRQAAQQSATDETLSV